MENDIILCSCTSTEHNIVASYDDEDNLLYCHIHLVHRPFLSRLYHGIRYILGHRSKYGEWDEFIVDSNNKGKFLDLLNKIK